MPTPVTVGNVGSVQLGPEFRRGVLDKDGREAVAKAKQVTPRGSPVGRFSWMPNGGIVFASGKGNLLSLSPDGSGRTGMRRSSRLF